jgi:hypothetical protein
MHICRDLPVVSTLGELVNRSDTKLKDSALFGSSLELIRAILPLADPPPLVCKSLSYKRQIRRMPQSRTKSVTGCIIISWTGIANHQMIRADRGLQPSLYPVRRSGH